MRSSFEENRYPLQREFRYFYNPNKHNPEADEFIDWIITGFTNAEFDEWLFDKEVVSGDGTVNQGTIPFQIGMQDLIVTDYEMHRDNKTDRLLRPDLEEAVSLFQFKNNQKVSVSGGTKLELPYRGANGTVITYKSTNENFLSTDGSVGRFPGAEVKLTVTIALGELKETLEVYFKIV